MISIFFRTAHEQKRHLEGSILFRWVIWHMMFFFACQRERSTYFLSANCEIHAFRIRSKQEHIKSTDFPTNVHDKLHACNWCQLSMHISSETVQATCVFKEIPSLVKFLPMRSNRSIQQWSTWISFVTDIKQTCLWQGLGVTITARKCPSKLMFTIRRT